MNKAFTCSFLGLGLIGGSLARAIRERIPGTLIKAYDVDTHALELAVSEGVVNESFSEISPLLCDCDYLFLCAPVQINLKHLELLPPLLTDRTLISDVGSVKGGIHKKICELGLEDRFIGGHPMTGSERYGYANSHASLLENAYYVLTPTESVSSERVKQFHDFVKQTGAIPYLLEVGRHDRATAAISHLPHLVASSLVNLVKEGDDEETTLKTLAAGGFKDITRIASSSAGLWQQICIENREPILDFLSLYIEHLSNLRLKLEKNDSSYLYDFFEEARIYRESFMDSRSGPLMKQYVLNLDIPDKTGAIATVATLLASHAISIKNMGIVHNREFQEGALRMELYSASEYEKAIDILSKFGYSIHT
ncbi:MAG: prephenate dehydrogenase [Lachnospiraceae bacterium]|nr:prephenate dehydrogenase [Lachnospiraceae bacterium]